MNEPVYPPPLDPALAIRVQGLDANLRDWFEERAAIREYMAEGVSREAAERAAWADLLRHFGPQAGQPGAPTPPETPERDR